MRRRGRRLRLRWIAAIVAVLVAAGVAAGTLSGGTPSVHTRSQFVAGTPEGSTPVQLDTTLYLPEHTPAPAVLLAHGFGGTKASVAGEAKALARRGYVVLTYTARGFGLSGGLIHLDSPQYEVHDASLLVSYLAGLPQVEKRDGAAQIAAAGSSYGGALALLLAGTDHRIKAVGADITWNDLAHALFPNGAGTGPGVFKKLWAGYLFSAGLGPSPTQCGRFAPEVCAAYERAATTGRPDSALLALLHASSPATVLSKITAPTLITQGEQDSLFPLSEADANARGIAANGTPVKVIWRLGGHDTGGGNAQAALIGWLDAVFAGRVHGGQPFRIDEPAAALSSEQGGAVAQSLELAGYPGIDGTPRHTRTFALDGPPQQVLAPAGGEPAAVTAVPLLGALLSQAGDLGVANPLSVVPGQTAAFGTAPLPEGISIAGAATVRLQVTSNRDGDATLFASLRDVSKDGTSVLPGNLVQPLYLTGLRAGVPATVPVRLPTVFLDAARGHRLVLTVATTDLAYQLPAEPRTYTIALADGGANALTVPVVSGSVHRAGTPVAWLIGGGAVAVAALVLVCLVLARRRRTGSRDTTDDRAPIVVTDLVKQYGDGYRAVDGVSFRVEAGQVVGLLGPNGAGKTTTLRVLVGLITPTSGTIHVFGEPVLPGAPVLARLGAFIEGPGFLPHLTGLQNLRSYWAATGRPEHEAGFDTALEIAGLGDSVRRRVKTYSHGMKQRLGIAQAMLGLPELLVLDEPTNGLDPPQIAEMREVLRSYAATGRTVVVSSHLLAEVEQTCTHVVVMHRGKLVAAGSVAEVAGAGAVQLAVADPGRAIEVLAAAGIDVQSVPARRALEDVFLDLVGEP